MLCYGMHSLLHCIINAMAIPIYSIVFSPDGKRVASASSDKTIRIWETSTGWAIHQLERHSGSVHSVPFSPDGELIASASDDTTFRFWNTHNGTSTSPPLQIYHKVLLSSEHHASLVLAIAFSPDGASIALASKDQTVVVWNVASSSPMFVLSGHSSPVTSVAFSPDGKHITSAADRAIRVWSVTTRTLAFAPLMGHSGIVKGVTFSSEGKHITSGSSDGTVRVRNAHRSAPAMMCLEGHLSGVYSLLIINSWHQRLRILKFECGICCSSKLVEVLGVN